MAKQVSFTKYENEVLPHFRQNLNKAESTEDVKKFFVYTAQKLFKSVFEEKNDFDFEDIVLWPEKDPYYVVSDRLLASNDFMSIWNDSDLPRVIGRLAETAMHRCKHLKKHPEKTESKIRM